MFLLKNIQFKNTIELIAGGEEMIGEQFFVSILPHHLTTSPSSPSECTSRAHVSVMQLLFL